MPRAAVRASTARDAARDLDLEWAALHTVLINIGTVIMEPGVSRQLRRPFITKRQVERWRQATTALFVAGEIRRASHGA